MELLTEELDLLTNEKTSDEIWILQYDPSQN